MATLQQHLPPGLGGTTGGGGGAPDATAALQTVVQGLSQTLQHTSNTVAQHNEQLANLKQTGTNLEGGISEVAGRVVALEEYAKTRPMGQASTTQAPGEAFDPWHAAAAARAGPTAAEANANTAQQAPGQGGRVGQPPTFDVSTPSGPQRERAPFNSGWRLDAKLSTDNKFSYDPKDTQRWLTKVKNYFVGQCPDAELLLKWAEQHGHTEITQHEVAACKGSLRLDADPVQVSQAVWS